MASKFEKVKKEHLKTLRQFVPIVARVHGDHHPEFHDVHKVFNEMNRKMDEATPNLGEEFKKLREITDNYKVPEDVCESYEAVYNMLEELDKAYHE